MDHKDVKPPMHAVLSSNSRAYAGCPAGTPVTVSRRGPFGTFFVQYQSGETTLMQAAEFEPAATHTAHGHQQGA